MTKDTIKIKQALEALKAAYSYEFLTDELDQSFDADISEIIAALSAEQREEGTRYCGECEQMVKEPCGSWGCILPEAAAPSDAQPQEQPNYPTFRGTIHRLPPPKQRPETPTHEVLARADGKVERILLLAYDKDGTPYFDTNIMDGGDVLWLMETCKKLLMEGGNG